LCTGDTCVDGKCKFSTLPSPATPTYEVDWENPGDYEGWVANPAISGLGWSQASGLGASSGAGALKFGLTAGGSFAAITGAVSSEVLGPKFKVPLGGGTVMTFAWKQMFTGVSLSTYPPIKVEILAGTKIWTAYTGYYTTSTAFTPVTVDLRPFGGQDVQVRLKGTVYGNTTTKAAGTGVLLDALKVQWSCDGAKACTADSSCANTVGCSEGLCVAGKCSYSYKCCAAAADCNDGISCTTDACATDKCQHTKAAGCCTSDAGCSDGLTCTMDSCGADNKCKFLSIADCCTADSQCNDGSACTIDSCKAGKCVYTDTCCKSDAECNDNDDKCTTDKCVAGKCTYASTGQPGCCLPELYKESFDGTGLTGWTLTNTSGATKGWQLWKTPSVAAKSAPAVLYYGDPLVKNFDFGGVASSGTATSATVTVPAASAKPMLKFWVYKDSEMGGGSYDRLDLYVVKAGVQSVLLTEGSSTYTAQAWKEISVDMSAFAGQTLQIRFSFATGDSVGNGGLGVLIDDVRLTQTCL
jgi:hypothetical protein